jgi:hypothetical protein
MAHWNPHVRPAAPPAVAQTFLISLTGIYSITKRKGFESMGKTLEHAKREGPGNGKVGRPRLKPEQSRVISC